MCLEGNDRKSHVPDLGPQRMGEGGEQWEETESGNGSQECLQDKLELAREFARILAFPQNLRWDIKPILFQISNDTMTSANPWIALVSTEECSHRNQSRKLM